MRAIVVDRWQEPKELVARDMPDPAPRAGEVVLEVEAAGCNFFDILLVQGKYQMKPPFPFVPGAEVAGVVRELGPAVQGREARRARVRGPRAGRVRRARSRCPRARCTRCPTP